MYTIKEYHTRYACRLVGPTGAPLVAQQLMRLRLSAVWALMVVFEGPVPVPGSMEGAFIQGSEVLSWAANNTAKLGIRHPAPYSNIQVWLEELCTKDGCKSTNVLSEWSSRKEIAWLRGRVLARLPSGTRDQA